MASQNKGRPKHWSQVSKATLGHMLPILLLDIEEIKARGLRAITMTCLLQYFGSGHSCTDLCQLQITPIRVTHTRDDKGLN